MTREGTRRPGGLAGWPNACRVSKRLRRRTTLAVIRPVKAFLVLLALVILPGCASVSARKVVALEPFQRIFVVERLNDNHRLHEYLVAELKRSGYEASSGPLTMMPENAQALLTYDARFEWDFKTYLVELNLELHTAHSRKKLADARYYQPSLVPKSPARVAREIITRMFAVESKPDVPAESSPAVAPAAVPRMP